LREVPWKAVGVPGVGAGVTDLGRALPVECSGDRIRGPMPSPTQSSPQPAKRVTAADVARSLGLSRATVGFVFNDTPGQSISDATKQRVFAEAQRLGYRPHTAARALASGRSRLVLLVLPDWPLDHAMRV